MKRLNRLVIEARNFQSQIFASALDWLTSHIRFPPELSQEFDMADSKGDERFRSVQLDGLVSAPQSR
jgi:hypothetical protein